MQIGNNVQVSDQGAQFCGRSKVKLGTIIDVKWLLIIVGLHAQLVHLVATFQQREAVNHFGGITTAQHSLALQTGSFGHLGIA